MLLLALVLLQTPPGVGPNKADEPLAKAYSFERGRAFMEQASVHWDQSRKCLTCHTNGAYLATGAGYGQDRPAYAASRKFTEELVSGRWPDKGPRWDAEVLVAAMSLAAGDAATGKLHPATRIALDRMWTVQKPDGGWNWLKCGWPPMESDDYYGATVALLAAGWAPEHYAATPAAKEGIAKARGYLAKHAPPSLHHKGMLFWASKVVDGLMTAEEQQKTVGELLAQQREDGGWALAAILPWKRTDGTEQDLATSDGYGTGYVIHLARLGGVPASDARIVRGLGWLKSHQRESGRWYTRSLKEDGKHFLTHAGTAFALLALHACGETR